MEHDHGDTVSMAQPGGRPALRRPPAMGSGPRSATGESFGIQRPPLVPHTSVWPTGGRAAGSCAELPVDRSNSIRIWR